MTTEQWVSRLNKLARQMDGTAASLHPSAWTEALAPLRKEYARLAALKAVGA
jgi:hypothetical protein